MSAARLFRLPLLLLLLPLLLTAGWEDELRLADGLFNRELFDLALTQYREVLARHPDLPDRALVLFRAGESARRLDRTETARGFFLEAVAADGSGPAAQRARLRLADLALRTEDYAAARREAEALLALQPEPVFAASALHTLGTSARQLGDPNAARDAFERLVNTYPDDVFAPYAALMLARMAPPRDQEARSRWYRIALRNPPSRDVEVEALWGLANQELEAGNTQEAAELFRRLWLAHPDSARVSGGMLHIAWALFLAERYEEALDVAARTPLRRREEHPDTWAYLEAVSLRLTDREEDAFHRYQQLLRETPNSRFRARAAFDLALMHARRGEHEQVLERAEDLLTLSERRVDGLWLLAESARSLGRVDDALRWYQAIARIEDSGARPADARFQRALLLRGRDPAAAAEALTDFARRHPADPRAAGALRSAGALWMEQGRADLALRLWDEAQAGLDAQAERAELDFQSGLLEMRSGRTDAARQRFQQHLREHPASPRVPEVTYWLAMLLDQAQDPGALSALEAALDQRLNAEQSGRVRLRLALRARQAEEPDRALTLLAPLIETPGSLRLPDALLLWLLEQEPPPEQALPIASLLVSEDRVDPVRELGFYARASAQLALGEAEDAFASWTQGLAFASESLDAARASLAFGEALLADGQPDAALPRLQAAQRLGSRLEQDALQVQAMYAMGQSYARLQNWAEAARMFLGLAVLFDDPHWSPRSLAGAADALRRDGRPEAANRALAELRQRYPAFVQETP